MLTEKQQCYQDHLRAAEAAGESLKSYADRHQVSAASLYAERGRMRRSGQATGFVRVAEASIMGAGPMALLQVRLPNGVSLGIPTGQLSVPDLIQTLARL